MSLDQAVRGRLIADAAVVAIIAQRVFPEARAQGSALPCIVYGIQDEQRLGGLSQFAGVSKAKVEINLLAASRASARALESAVAAALDYWGGAATGTGYSVTIQGSRHQQTMTGYIEPAAGESVGTFFSTMFFQVHYS